MYCDPASQWMISADPNCPGMGGDAFLNAFMAENPSAADAPKDPVLAAASFNQVALFGSHQDPGIFIGLLPPPEVLAPVMGAVAAPAAVLGGIGALGIGASLAVGAPPPVESLTGSGFEPQTEAAATPPPSGPPGNLVALADELPPNWWDLASAPWNPQFQLPTLSDILRTVGDVTAPSKAGNWYNTLQSGLNWLSSLGGLRDTTPITDPTLSPAGLPGPDQPGSEPEPGPLPEITIEAPRPSGAPLVVADPGMLPGLLPLPGFAPGIAPSRSPAPQPRPRVAPVPVASPGFAPAVAPAPAQSPSPVKAPQPVQAPSAPIASPLYPPGGTTIAPAGSRVPLPIWTPTPNPAVPDEAPQLAALNPAAVQQKTCKDQSQQKKKRKKHARTVCHVGTYRELKSGLIKHATRTIPCR
jgi:hypothetical protein